MPSRGRRLGPEVWALGKKWGCRWGFPAWQALPRDGQPAAVWSQQEAWALAFTWGSAVSSIAQERPDVAGPQSGPSVFSLGDFHGGHQRGQ